ncbi:PRC-barrel domain-containing protein [Thermosyntropha sp.]|uniref:PRC-barrel domain-containing protein n=1 Tax=Thermosyntropha sp. TaxID=2740820 RepID=UPI0025ECF4CE|nr:PRC-barrel domain-containing protein [Thermosyntropha sp.]MBO8159817.1 PRC-barrel domain-containing protein [Thermosyntropha sp.]
MKIKEICGLPVFYKKGIKILGTVEKVVIGDNYEVSYIVIQTDKKNRYMIEKGDFILTSEAVVIDNLKSIKSYICGEELSIYDKKIGDAVFDEEGKELGVVSDFIISPENGKVQEVEISAGILSDFLQGRFKLPISKVVFKNKKSMMVKEGGKD